MQLSKLGTDNSHQEVEGKVGANYGEAKIVDDHHVSGPVQKVVHLRGGPTLKGDHLQNLQQGSSNVVKRHVTLHAQDRHL